MIDTYAIRESRIHVQLKPQDVLVVLKLASMRGRGDSTYVALGESLAMSASEVHAAIRRLAEARLVSDEGQEVRLGALRNFLVHGVPYVFPARAKEVTRGIPTAWAAPVMQNAVQSGDQLPPVWPDPKASTQGVAVRPLYASAPRASERDDQLYSLLALVDVLRLGRARERAIAERKLAELLPSHG